MTKAKYYALGGNYITTETFEFSDERGLLEYVRRHYNMHGSLPDVYHGEKLEFDPEEKIVSWKIKRK